MPDISMCEIKKKMKEYRDFFGGDMIGFDKIDKARTKKQLKEIIHEHSTHLEMVARDAQSHIDHFKRTLNLPY